ncbi:MAG: insulinase family protein [Deltaproteobacteria bacterium]|nr:insulinase family protein [Deltaproteobacteria bacterium]
MKPDDRIEKTLLSNGVRILSQRMPHVQSVSMGVWVNIGSRDETDAENGLSHFIEHMMFKGTQKRSAFEIAKAFDAIGGYTNAFTSMENTCYHAKVMANHLETMSEILTDIFLNSLFDETEIEKERPVIFQEIGMLEDTPDEYVHQLAARSFWGDNPLGRSILGTHDNILQFDSKNIRSFFERLYQPDRIVVTAVGNIEHDRLVDLARPAFEAIQTGNPIPNRGVPQSHFHVGIHPKDLEQVHICLNTPGIPTTDSRRYVLSLMNTILGGNMSSRLFQEIREQRGLAYSVYSFVSSFVDTGMSGAYAGVDPVHAFETVDLVLNTLQGLKDSPVTEDELQHAKEFTKGNLLMASESNENQMARLAQGEFHFGRYTPLKEILDEIDRVTPSDIQMLAEDIFQKNQMTLTLHGPVQEDSQFEQLMMA